MDQIKDANHAIDIMTNVTYGFNDRYGLSFLTPVRHERVQRAISYLRRHPDYTSEECYTLSKIIGRQGENYQKIRRLESQEPRFIAQKFIGKKNIREWLFNRDKHKCLKCGSKDNLTIDHIVPIHRDGQNKLSNLQSLCRSCNSSKGSNFKDYRYGS